MDPDGNWFVSKNKKTKEYGIGTNRHGIYYFNYLVKAVANFIPFGGYAINVGTAFTKIDPTTDWSVLFNSDDVSMFNTSDLVDGVGFIKSFSNLKEYNLLGKICSFLGATSVITDYINDDRIEKFMNAQDSNLFQGVQSDKDAINLAKYLAAGALYYYDNEDRLREKGISESCWGKRIRNATNGIYGHPVFESFKELEKADKLDL